MSDTKKILVIDDSALNRKVLEEALQGKGYSVETAEDGEQALKQLNAAPPDLVIMDVVMPNMNGLEATKQMRKAAKTGGIPIILMTSKNTPQDMLQAFEVGADEFLDKPVDMDELYSTVERLLVRGASPEQGIQ